MLLSQATFGLPPTRVDKTEVDEAITSYLISLQRNGQICGDFLHSLCKGKYVAYAYLARPDATQKDFYSQYGMKDLELIRQLFGSDPSWEVLADEVPNNFHDFSTSSFLYLFSSFDGASPICCGDTGEPLPSYLIPIEDDDRERLYFWSREYNRMDNIWFSSGELEIAAYQQLASPHSLLAKQGMELAANIEAVLKKPTYYFLMRYYGRGDREQNRRCPRCNGDWRVTYDGNESLRFWHFPFRCVECRLVSQMADAAYDPEWAHIGEFQPLPQEDNR